MSWGEEQQKEIETIRERKITVKLSDADCDRLARKCGKHGLTIGELIENFVGDLVGGTYSNGSDERDYADQWFERCWFGMFPEPTLLNHLLNFGYEPEHYLDMLENVETIKSDIEITKQNIAEPSKVFEFYTEDYADTMSLAVFLISLAVSVYFAEPIRAVIPINLLLLLILVHIVYVLIRWYVKGCMRSRGYY